MKGLAPDARHSQQIVRVGEGGILFFDQQPGDGGGVTQVDGQFEVRAAGLNFSDVLKATGDYRVRVYLMGGAACRNESANYTISFEITKTPLGALGPKPKVIGAP